MKALPFLLYSILAFFMHGVLIKFIISALRRLSHRNVRLVIKIMGNFAAVKKMNEYETHFRLFDFYAVFYRPFC